MELQRNLTDLPNELLALILQRVGGRELLAMARAGVFQRLHDIVLRAFFTLHCFDPHSPQPSLKLQDGWEPFTLLPVIRLSSLRKATRLYELYCDFEALDIFKRMIDVRELILVLPAVSIVRFRFSYSLYNLWTSASDSTWLAFVDILITLLNSLKAKSCIHLEIIGLAPPPSIDRSRKGVVLHPVDSLQEVRITTGHTLYGKLLDWVVLSLNSSPVHTLKLNSTLHYHRFLRFPYDYTALALLSRANLPQLVNLRVSIPTKAQDIVPVFPRHANITTLHINDWYPSPKSRNHPHFPVFPQLSTLVAVPTFIIDCVAHQEVVPVLQTVRLLTEVHRDFTSEDMSYAFIHREITQAFLILSKCATIHSLSITMDGEYADWMKRSIDRDADDQTKINIFLPHITHLALLLPVRREPAFMQLQWLSTMFPNVSSLLYEGCMADSHRKAFLPALGEECPKVVKVSFSRNESPIPVTELVMQPGDQN